MHFLTTALTGSLLLKQETLHIFSVPAIESFRGIRYGEVFLIPFLVCRRALGMENYGIKKEQITLSSVSSDSKAVCIRPNINGNYWCAKVK